MWIWIEISHFRLINLSNLNENKIIVAGGQENMSRAPHAIFYREDKKLEENKLVDTMVNDGLIDSFNNYHMGITAENIADKV